MLGLRSKPTAEQHALVEPRDEIGSHSEKRKKRHGLLATGRNVLAGRWSCKEGHAAGERHRRFVGKRNSAAVRCFGKHSQDCVLARRFTFFCDASLDPCGWHTKATNWVKRHVLYLPI